MYEIIRQLSVKFNNIWGGIGRLRGGGELGRGDLPHLSLKRHPPPWMGEGLGKKQGYLPPFTGAGGERSETGGGMAPPWEELSRASVTEVGRV